MAFPRVLVIGDLILDRYVFGSTERVSPEAPVVVLEADRQETQLGGAAAVALLAMHLDCEVQLSGVVGDDSNGRVLLALARKLEIDISNTLVDLDRQTTTKERFIGSAGRKHDQHLIRVDWEQRTPISGQLVERILEKLADSAADAILISDYGKGVCTPELLGRVIDRAKKTGVPVVVDPARGEPLTKYRGATLMTPNRMEAELASGRKIFDTEAAYDVGGVIREASAAENVAITLDKDGIALVTPIGRRHIPSCECNVSDTTGAGDMVLAAVGVCLATGRTIDNALQTANVAAGLQVERQGIAVVTWDEIDAASSEHSQQAKTR